MWPNHRSTRDWKWWSIQEDENRINPDSISGVIKTRTGPVQWNVIDLEPKWEQPNCISNWPTKY